MNIDYLRKLPDNIIVNYIYSMIKNRYYSISDYIKYKKSKKNMILKKNPLISIYIPTYNRSQLLMERAIKSVLNQTYTNFELLIIDDGSTDDTEIKVMSIEDKRIKYYKINRTEKYRYPNKAIYHWFSGPVVAANFALKKLQGDWIARIDDDDEWTAEHLDLMITFALSGDFEFVSSVYMTISNDGEQKLTSADPANNIGGTQTWLYRSYLKCIEYNLDCWRKNYNRVNDTDLQNRFFNLGLKIGFLNKVTCIIRPRPGENYTGSKAYIKNSRLIETSY
jgi:glycosyltransferase involved in cell wall biosynthesis